MSSTQRTACETSWDVSCVGYSYGFSSDEKGFYPMITTPVTENQFTKGSGRKYSFSAFDNPQWLGVAVTAETVATGTVVGFIGTDAVVDYGPPGAENYDYVEVSKLKAIKADYVGARLMCLNSIDGGECYFMDESPPRPENDFEEFEKLLKALSEAAE